MFKTIIHDYYISPNYFMIETHTYRLDFSIKHKNYLFCFQVEDGTFFLQILYNFSRDFQKLDKTFK